MNKKFSLLLLSYSFFTFSFAESFKAPLGLPPVPFPQDNPYTKKKAELGKLLYFDTCISADEKISCATCHAESRAFADPNPISEGILGRLGTRHAPTVINAAYNKHQFWDGRVKTLEEQAKGPIANTKEMSFFHNSKISYEECQKRVRQNPEYLKMFRDVFGDEECTVDQIVQAIATFERTVLSGNSPYDRYKAGDETAMTKEQIEGYRIFKKVGCNNCHTEPLFTDGRFLNIGVGMTAEKPDLGRYDITKDPKDYGAFKTPTLRESAKSPPYMHDGSEKTLEDVIDYYDRGGNPNKNLHPLMKPLHLTEQDKKALKAFIEALNGEGWQDLTPSG
ncbi:MAG TPA: cytochrome c peroxidase [Parachlamydiaceae bacterium]|nr:cytochrome c peroxidase [Parachlamydiaceae bacterium]